MKPFSQEESQILLRAIDKSHYFQQAGVVVSCMNNQKYQLRSPYPQLKQQTWIVLKEKNENEQQRNSGEVNSRMRSELVGMGISCTVAAISVIGAAGTGVAAGPTAGGTAPISIWLAVQAGISGAQCANSIMRVKNEAFSPAKNDYLDSNEWYTRTAVALDTYSLVGPKGAVSTGFSAVKNIYNMKITTNKSYLELLKGLSKSARKELDQQIMELKKRAEKVSTRFASEKRPTLGKELLTTEKALQTQTKLVHVTKELKDQLLNFISAGLVAIESKRSSTGVINGFHVWITSEK